MIPIKNMWQELMIRVMAPKPINLTHIKASSKEVWANIPLVMYSGERTRIVNKQSGKKPNKCYGLRLLNKEIKFIRPGV